MLNTTGECKVIAIANQKSGAVSDTRQSMSAVKIIPMNLSGRNF